MSSYSFSCVFFICHSSGNDYGCHWHLNRSDPAGTAAKTVTEDLVFTIVKNNNAYDIKVGSQKLATFNCSYEINNYYEERR